MIRERIDDDDHNIQDGRHQTETHAYSRVRESRPSRDSDGRLLPERGGDGRTPWKAVSCTSAFVYVCGYKRDDDL